MKKFFVYFIVCCISISLSNVAFSAQKKFKISNFEKNIIYFFLSGESSKGELDKDYKFLLSVLDGEEDVNLLGDKGKSIILMSVGINEAGLGEYCNYTLSINCLNSFSNYNYERSYRFEKRNNIPYINLLSKQSKIRLLELDDYLGMGYYHKSIDIDLPDSYLEKIREYDDGQYRVGVDIPAGEYQLFATKSSRKIPIKGMYKIEKDLSGNAESFIKGDHFSKNVFIRIENGQYLTIEDAYAIKVND